MSDWLIKMPIYNEALTKVKSMNNDEIYNLKLEWQKHTGNKNEEPSIGQLAKFLVDVN